MLHPADLPLYPSCARHARRALLLLPVALAALSRPVSAQDNQPLADQPAQRSAAFPPLGSTPEIDVLHAAFVDSVENPAYYTYGRPVREQLVIWSLSGMSFTYYSLQIPLDGIISMFEATGREEHFQLALELCENMVAAAWLDRNMDGHPEWDGSVNGVPPSDGRPDVMLYDLQASVCIARLSRIILTNPALNAEYGARAQEMLDFVEDHIVDKWMITHNVDIWLEALPNWGDKASMFARILADIYAATGNQWRRTQCTNLCLQFIATVLVHDLTRDSYSWPDVTSADTSHTNREPMFIDACVNAGIVFTDNDLRRVGNNLVEVMWNGSLADPRITNYHTGANGPVPGSNRGPWEWGLIYEGWVVTGRVHPTAQAIGNAICQLAQSDPDLNPTVYRCAHANAIIAFTGHLARNIRLNMTCSATCGDLNGNGLVNMADFQTFASCYGLMAPNGDCPPPTFSCADLSGDGAVSLLDWQTFSTLFNNETYRSPPSCFED